MKLINLSSKLLQLLPPETAHDLAIWGLKHSGRGKIITPAKDSINLWGLNFKNRLGLAAGFDKNATCSDGLFKLGFGFVEVGTVTPKPQLGNPKPRLFRLRKQRALINRMGFNNHGVDAALKNLQQRRYHGAILGINIGKNKDTPNERAIDDYTIAQRKCHGYADYLTINISSPNTPKLRELFTPAYLDELLSRLKQQQVELNLRNGKEVPLLLKLSPDMPAELLATTIDLVLRYKIDGVIATNTTVSRPIPDGSKHKTEVGGFSGKDLFPISYRMVQEICDYTKKSLPVIACGGVMGEEQFNAYLDAGAKLVQTYTGFIYDSAKIIKLTT